MPNTNANDTKQIKPYLDHINKRDGKLGLKLWTDITGGFTSEITADLNKARSEGLGADADKIQAWLDANKNKIGTVPKTWSPSIPGINVSNPLGPLFNAHIWIRVGEVALGLILIAVGVAKLTNAVPVATKIAGIVK